MLDRFTAGGSKYGILSILQSVIYMQNLDLELFCCGQWTFSILVFFCIVVLSDFMCILHVLPLA